VTGVAVVAAFPMEADIASRGNEERMKKLTLGKRIDF
jgi:hypothetical protein